MRKSIKVILFFVLVFLLFTGALMWLKEYAKADIRESVKSDVLKDFEVSDKESSFSAAYEVPSDDYLTVPGEDGSPDLNVFGNWIKIARHLAGPDDDDTKVLHLAAVIEIPSLGIEEPVWVEDSLLAMRYGVILMSGFASLDEEGNSVIVGHRSLTTSKHFWNLTDIDAEDAVIITTPDGTEHKYRVSGTYYCSPFDLQDYLETPDGCSKQVTLVTCAKERGNSWRFIVTLVPC